MGCVCFFRVAILMGGFVLSKLLVADVIVDGGRFLGNGWVGDVGRSITLKLCCEDVLSGKRVIG